MTIRVMLVDDSPMTIKTFTMMLKRDPEIEIVATAENGEEAIEVVRKEKPDVMLLDIEMPVMTGIEALPHLIKASPNTNIIMASAFTQQGAKVTLEALQKGAVDYIPKPNAEFKGDFYQEVTNRIKTIANHATQSAEVSNDNPFALNPVRKTAKQPIEAIGIASSTGGPRALISVLSGLRHSNLEIPIFITQHMPASFTAALAESLSHSTGLRCIEAWDGLEVEPGAVYIAPGDYHMVLESSVMKTVIRTNQSPKVNFCRPAADVMFRSLIDAYGANLLTLTLTGMGADGKEGAVEASKKGATVISQDIETSVVPGMTRAIIDTGLCDAVLPLEEIGSYLANRCAA